MEIGKLIEGALKVHASDIHLIEGWPPYLRVDQVLHAVDAPPLSQTDIAGLLKPVIQERLGEKLQTARGIDIGYQHGDLVRCRVVVYYERQHLTAVFRLIPIEVPTIEALDLPEEFAEYADFHRGMVLVTGPTGCGKSTTLAALVDQINAHRHVAITTIEDPIEFVHRNKKAIVRQREVGDDVQDFRSGLIQSLRQDPDVIMLGEMRDYETMRTAIQAAETGHLVMTTLHTSSAVKAIERIMDVFPEPEHRLLREQMAANFRVVMTQELVRRKVRGQIAAFEVMVVTDYVAKLILENRVADIFDVMKHEKDGMRTLDQGLAHLVREDKIAEEEALRFARDPHALHRYIKGILASSDLGGVPEAF